MEQRHDPNCKGGLREPAGADGAGQGQPSPDGERIAPLRGGRSRSVLGSILSCQVHRLRIALPLGHGDDDLELLGQGQAGFRSRRSTGAGIPKSRGPWCYPRHRIHPRHSQSDEGPVPGEGRIRDKSGRDHSRRPRVRDRLTCAVSSLPPVIVQGLGGGPRRPGIPPRSGQYPWRKEDGRPSYASSPWTKSPRHSSGDASGLGASLGQLKM